MARKSAEPRVPLITRTVVTNYHYKFYKLVDGKIEFIKEEDRAEKIKDSELSEMSKEFGCTVIKELSAVDEKYLGITVEQFMKIAKPVKDGKLVG
nr:MAG TPA: hypothetical protein [Caudoviricetes sp.]